MTQPGDVAPTADEAWRALLHLLVRHGQEVAPRGRQTLEVLHHVSLTTDLNHPVVTCPARRLNYRFMAAEALWIAAGQDDLARLTAVNPHMAEFSDDGKTLAGAYGPRLRPQVPYVVQTLLLDRDTRQAAMTVWRPCPLPSKDLPCTVAMVFSIRHNRLYQHAFMRSSDAWLGIPYDVFSFSFLGIEIACQYNLMAARHGVAPVGLGHLTVTCTSSHLYRDHYLSADDIVRSSMTLSPPPTVDPTLVTQGDFGAIAARVAECERRSPGGTPRYPL